MTAATFAAVFVILWVGHQIGDFWVQSSHQAAHKGKPGWTGRWACTQHVATLTLTKLLLLLPSATVLDLHLSSWGLLLGLGLDSAAHWWADRRSTLAWLAGITGKAEFHDLGADVVDTGTAEDGITGRHLGRGSHALDQSFHAFWLLAAALITAAV
ncbi:transcriptional regulator [Kitasatospora aureofaciens]|uniref:transcriptional regulator n=1 Tax=Kitasatospora aureofaciens TaxID=1894 RepID=UPI0034059362